MGVVYYVLHSVRHRGGVHRVLHYYMGVVYTVHTWCSVLFCFSEVAELYNVYCIIYIKLKKKKHIHSSLLSEVEFSTLH